MVSLSLSESPASYCGDKPPRGCLQRAVFQCVLSSSVLQRSALPVYSNISVTTRQTPASQKQPELIHSKTELQRETRRGRRLTHSVKLFIFSVSVQMKKKKEHFQWVKLLSWDLCSGRRSVKDKMRCFKLFTVCSLPSLRSPSKLFFPFSSSSFFFFPPQGSC